METVEVNGKTIKRCYDCYYCNDVLYNNFTLNHICTLQHKIVGTDKIDENCPFKNKSKNNDYDKTRIGKSKKLL